MSFDVELTVSITGMVTIEADSIENARALAGQIQVATADVTFMNAPGGMDDGGIQNMAMYDIEVEGVYEAEPEEQETE